MLWGGAKRLRFIGITDVEFVYAEDLNMGEDTRNQAFAEAKERLVELAS